MKRPLGSRYGLKNTWELLGSSIHTIFFQGGGDRRGNRNMCKIPRGFDLKESHLGVGGGHLVERTGHSRKYSFYVPVRVRDRACCNRH